MADGDDEEEEELAMDKFVQIWIRGVGKFPEEFRSEQICNVWG